MNMTSLSLTHSDKISLPRKEKKKRSTTNAEPPSDTMTMRGVFLKTKPLQRLFATVSNTTLTMAATPEARKCVLAPMVRTGELPTRLLALKYGADLVWGSFLFPFSSTIRVADLSSRPRDGRQSHHWRRSHPKLAYQHHRLHQSQYQSRREDHIPHAPLRRERQAHLPAWDRVAGARGGGGEGGCRGRRRN